MGAQLPPEEDRRQGAMDMDDVKTLLVCREQKLRAPGHLDVAQQMLEKPPREVHRHARDQPPKPTVGPGLRNRQPGGHALIKHSRINI